MPTCHFDPGCLRQKSFGLPGKEFRCQTVRKGPPFWISSKGYRKKPSKFKRSAWSWIVERAQANCITSSQRESFLGRSVNPCRLWRGNPKRQSAPTTFSSRIWKCSPKSVEFACQAVTNSTAPQKCHRASAGKFGLGEVSSNIPASRVAATDTA